MGFFSEIKSALREIFAEFSQPVIWRGREMNAIIAEGQEAVELESGGFVPDSTFNVKFLESELGGETPRIGEIVEYNGTIYSQNIKMHNFLTEKKQIFKHPKKIQNDQKLGIYITPYSSLQAHFTVLMNVSE